MCVLFHIKLFFSVVFRNVFRAMIQSVKCRPVILMARVQARPVHVGFVVDRVGPGCGCVGIRRPLVR